MVLKEILNICLGFSWPIFVFLLIYDSCLFLLWTFLSFQLGTLVESLCIYITWFQSYSDLCHASSTINFLYVFALFQAKFDRYYLRPLISESIKKSPILLTKIPRLIYSVLFIVAVAHLCLSFQAEYCSPEKGRAGEDNISVNVNTNANVINNDHDSISNASTTIIDLPKGPPPRTLRISSMSYQSILFLISLAFFAYGICRRLQTLALDELERTPLNVKIPKGWKGIKIFIKLLIIQVAMTFTLSIPLAIAGILIKIWKFNGFPGYTILCLLGVVFGTAGFLMEKRRPFPTFFYKTGVHILNIHARMFCVLSLIPTISYYFFNLRNKRENGLCYPGKFYTFDDYYFTVFSVHVAVACMAALKCLLLGHYSRNLIRRNLLKISDLAENQKKTRTEKNNVIETNEKGLIAENEAEDEIDTSTDDENFDIIDLFLTSNTNKHIEKSSVKVVKVEINKNYERKESSKEIIEDGERSTLSSKIVIIVPENSNTNKKAAARKPTEKIKEDQDENNGNFVIELSPSVIWPRSRSLISLI